MSVSYANVIVVCIFSLLIVVFHSLILCDKIRIFSDETTTTAEEEKIKILMLENLSSGYIHNFIGLIGTMMHKLLADSYFCLY